MKKRPLIIIAGCLITLILIGGLFLVFGQRDNGYYNYDLVIDEYDDVLEIDTIEEIVIEETTVENKETTVENKETKEEKSNNTTETKKENNSTAKENGSTQEVIRKIKVELDIDENPGFALMDVRCYFDEKALSFDSYSNGNVHPGVFSTKEVKKDRYGSYILLDFDYIDKEYTKCGSLAYLVFEVKDEKKVERSSIKFVVQEVYNSVPEELEGVVLSSKFVK